MIRKDKKTIDATIVSLKMQKTAIVAVSKILLHPLYKKIIKKDSRIKVDLGRFLPKVGDKVRIAESRPLSKDKHFRIVEVIKK